MTREPIKPGHLKTLGEGGDVAAAYGRVEADIAAMKPEDVGHLTANVTSAASIALGALSNLRTLREAFVTELKNPPLEELDRLADLAAAAMYTDLQCMPRYSEAQLQGLLEECRGLRQRMLAAAEALVHFELLDAALVAEIRSGSGNLDMARDLVALSVLFGENWDSVGRQTPVTNEMVARAGELGLELFTALGLRDVGDLTEGDLSWSDRRARAFRLLVRAYNRLRAAAAYVRQEQGDADAYAPTLHRRSRGGRSEPEPAAEPDEPSPSDPVGPSVATAG